MPTQLIVISGPDKGRVFAIEPGGSFTIGRSLTSNTQLTDVGVSRNHCEVRLDGYRAYLVDAQSAGGTFVNGERISEHELLPGDVIRVGSTELRLDQEVPGQSTFRPPRPVVKPILSPLLADALKAKAPDGRNLPLPLRELCDLAGKSIGNFQLLRLIGPGHVGVVFQAKDKKEDKIVALKVMRPDFAEDKHAVQRLRSRRQGSQELSTSQSCGGL